MSMARGYSESSTVVSCCTQIATHFTNPEWTKPAVDQAYPLTLARFINVQMAKFIWSMNGSYIISRKEQRNS